MGYNFNNTNEEAPKVFEQTVKVFEQTVKVKKENPYIQPGIHQVEIKSITTAEVPPKGDNSSWTKGVITFECIKTLSDPHADSKGKTIAFDIVLPNPEGADLQEKFDKFAKRLLHILKYSQGESKVQASEDYFKAIIFNDATELVAALQFFVGGKQNMKVGVDKDKKFSQVPMYYNGFCEVLSETTKLWFNPKKEDYAPQDLNKVEVVATAPIEELPF